MHKTKEERATRNFDGKLLVASIVLGLVAFYYMSAYLDARQSLRATCEIVSKEYKRSEEDSRSVWLEGAWDACGEAEALP